MTLLEHLIAIIKPVSHNKLINKRLKSICIR